MGRGTKVLKPADRRIRRGCEYAFYRYELGISARQTGKIFGVTHSTVMTVGNDYFYLVNNKRIPDYQEAKFRTVGYIRKVYDEVKRSHSKRDV